MNQTSYPTHLIKVFRKDLNLSNLRNTLLIGFAGLLCALQVGVYFSLSFHNHYLAKTLASSVRNTIMTGDFRQTINNLNSARRDSLTDISYYDQKNKEVFTLKGTDPIFYEALSAVNVPIFQSGNNSELLGHLVFTYQQTWIYALVLGLWLLSLFSAWPLFIYGKKSIESHHLEILHNDRLKEKTMMALQVAHDLRSPLSALTIFLQVKGNSLLPKEIEMLSMVNNRILSISNDLLQKARDTPYDVTVLELTNATYKILDEKRILHPNVVLELVEKILSPARNVLVKLSDWERAVSNLIDNSIDATTKNAPRVQIHLWSDQYKFVLTCQDNGDGILPANLKALRSSPRSIGKVNGNGLGLLHLKNFVEEAGGSWQIDSDGAHGTKVSVSLPMASA